MGLRYRTFPDAVQRDSVAPLIRDPPGKLLSCNDPAVLQGTTIAREDARKRAPMVMRCAREKLPGER